MESKNEPFTFLNEPNAPDLNLTTEERWKKYKETLAAKYNAMTPRYRKSLQETEDWLWRAPEEKKP